MTVIRCNEQYKKAVQQICLDVAGEERGTKKSRYLLAMYCDNYLENEIALVLLDDNKPIGYILCAPDYDAYEEHMRPYLRKIRKLPPLYFLMAKGEMPGYRQYKDEYPAHLHVDILEECTGRHGGTLLMEALCDELRIRGIPGLMLQVAAGNKRAISYYQKMGFEVLDQNSHVLKMGKKLA